MNGSCSIWFLKRYSLLSGPGFFDPIGELVSGRILGIVEEVLP